jgi:hypothetical protein
MKIDPGMHIGLHLVFFGKTGVTKYHNTMLFNLIAIEGALCYLISKTL